MKRYCRKPLFLLSSVVVMADRNCKARLLTEEIEEKEDTDFQLFLCQVFCNHNLFTCPWILYWIIVEGKEEVVKEKYKEREGKDKEVFVHEHNASSIF